MSHAPFYSPLIAPIFADGTAGSDQTALTHSGRRVSYAELRANVTAIAEWLVRAGVKPGDRVAILLPKSIEAVELIFAALATGAAYVPINHKLPDFAVRPILRDVQPRLVVMDAVRATELMQAGDVAGLRIAVIGRNGLMIVNAASGDEPISSPDGDLAAILYTSGSTGEPKGIMLSAQNILSFVEWAASTFSFTSADRVANHAPLHFDLSILDIFATLSRHGAVHLLDETTTRFPGAMRGLIDKERISVWYSVPTALVHLEERHALKGADSLRLILFAGEVFPMPALRRLMQELPGPQYANLYGPTETNVCAYYRLPGIPASDSDVLPIGKPCEHLEIRLCDSDGGTVAAGETGEICVAGPSVMRGYWRQPERTEATKLRGRNDSYRTGDYGYARADGLLMLKGRRDQQAKLRGHRVELLALEAVLNAHPGLKEAVASVVPDERAGGLLVVHAVARSGRPEFSEIKTFLAARLAPYYQPDRIEWLWELPRTATGKCDRSLLRSMAEKRARN